MLSKYVKLPSLQHLKKNLALLMKISSPKYRHFAQNFYSLSIHSSPWSYQLNLSRLQSFTFAAFILVTMFFHFTHFVFYLIHYRSVPYERLKPIVTFVTSFTARFSHTYKRSILFFQLFKYGYSSLNIKLFLNSLSDSVISSQL